MSKAASLTSNLVAKKGQAVPAIPALGVDVASQNLKQINTVDYYKALTVKLDKDRYAALKNAGVKLDKKSQEIFVEALDLWLKQNTQL